MDVLKKNLFFILCGLAAFVGIALSLVGLKSMGDVRGRMEAAATLLNELRRTQGGGTVNRQVIQTVQNRVRAVEADYQAVLEWAYERNRREPLIAGVFPDPRGLKKKEFRDAYMGEFGRFLERLKAGEPPSSREIQDMAQIIKNEAPRRGDPFAPAQKDTRDRSKDEEPRYRSELITDEQARQTSDARASLLKAQGLFCYASPFSFDRNSRIYEGYIDLEPAALWDAQMGLWIQQDLVEALARVNQNAAEALTPGTNAWVGVLPVKELVSIRVSDYVLEGDEQASSAPAPPVGDKPADPPGAWGESFTGQRCTKFYDVIQFSVKLVVDARDIPVILNEICKGRFFTPFRVSYVVEPHNLSMANKIYGEDPVVRLVVDFEAYFFADLYRRLMPEEILKRIGAERPAEESP